MICPQSPTTSVSEMFSLRFHKIFSQSNCNKRCTKRPKLCEGVAFAHVPNIVRSGWPLVFSKGKNGVENYTSIKTSRLTEQKKIKKRDSDISWCLERLDCMITVITVCSMLRETNHTLNTSIHAVAMLQQKKPWRRRTKKYPHSVQQMHHFIIFSFDGAVQGVKLIKPQQLKTQKVIPHWRVMQVAFRGASFGMRRVFPSRGGLVKSVRGFLHSARASQRQQSINPLSSPWSLSVDSNLLGWALSIRERR